MKVEFYYSSKDEPAKQFFCDNKKALELCEKLKGKGVPVKVQDCGATPVAFMTYNAAVTGPSASKRAVFGAKGALEEDMGKAVPALLVFTKDGDRYPEEVTRSGKTSRSVFRLSCSQKVKNNPIINKNRSSWKWYSQSQKCVEVSHRHIGGTRAAWGHASYDSNRTGRTPF